MIKGYLFDFGGTLDTAGCHWGQMLWHAYQRQQVPVTEEQFREAADEAMTTEAEDTSAGEAIEEK